MPTTDRQDLSVLPKELINPIWDTIQHPVAPEPHGGDLNLFRDHIALALKSYDDLHNAAEYMVDNGARFMLGIHHWPNAICRDLRVPVKHQKYMAVLETGTEWIVLLAPYSGDDLIDQTYKNAGEPTVHHVAYRISQIDAVRNDLLEVDGVTQISGIADDPGKLSQVFMAIHGDSRILELIERNPEFDGTFTCNNIQTLTEGEAKHDRHKGE